VRAANNASAQPELFPQIVIDQLSNHSDDTYVMSFGVLPGFHFNATAASGTVEPFVGRLVDIAAPTGPLAYYVFNLSSLTRGQLYLGNCRHSTSTRR